MFKPVAVPARARRMFLQQAGATALSATAIALLSGCESMAQTSSRNPDQEAGLLTVARAREHEAINPYPRGAESGLLQKPVLETAVLFQSHHKAHRDALAATIRKLGGRPVEARPMAEYAKALQAGMLKNQADVLNLAARLELGATNAYLGVIPSFKDTALAKVAARLAADETMHWTVLNGALARALPQGALTFGA